jgi:hypothetical protein
MITHGESGILIDTKSFDCDALFRGYRVDRIPADFHEYMTESVHKHLVALVESRKERERLGDQARVVAGSKFSFARHNTAKLAIYREALEH